MTKKWTIELSECSDGTWIGSLYDENTTAGQREQWTMGPDFDTVMSATLTERDRRNGESKEKKAEPPAGFVFSDTEAIVDKNGRGLAWHPDCGLSTPHTLAKERGWRWLAFDTSKQDALRDEVLRLGSQLNEVLSVDPWPKYQELVDHLLQMLQQRDGLAVQLREEREESGTEHSRRMVTVAERDALKKERDALAVELQAAKAERDTLREVIVNAKGRARETTPQETREQAEERCEAWRYSKGVIGEHNTATVWLAFLAGAGFKP